MLIFINAFMNPFVKGLALLTLAMIFLYALFDRPSQVKPKNQAAPSAIPTFKKITHFPQQIEPKCREGIAKIYDECGDQRTLLAQAIQTAKEQNKHVLMVYGAEWCIWCHVFDQYVKGGHKQFYYQWQYHDGDDLFWLMHEKEGQAMTEQALALNHYVADNFVLTHIESYYSNGEDVMIDLGFDVSTIQYVPLIFSLDAEGKLASQMKHKDQIKGLEIRESGGEEYRGYDRALLLKELKRIKSEAIIPSNN